MMNITKDNLNEFIDFTLLKPFATEEDFKAFFHTAIQENYIAVCVPPMYINKAKSTLGNKDIKVATVAAFPLGFFPPQVKEKEIMEYIDMGADEIDMVINLSAVKSGNYDIVRDEMRRAVNVCAEEDVILKVIIESGNLTIDEIKKVCEIAAEEKPDFVKTSTGFLGKGAELDKVKLMRELLPAFIKIKASGGIRTPEKAIEFINAGASRIGTSTPL